MCARHLGIDYGLKRIGLAVSDVGGGIASPLTTVKVGSDVSRQAAAVIQAAEPYDVQVFVVGLPINMDGTEGTQAKTTRAFADNLQSQLPAHRNTVVRLWDERQSSMDADEQMAMTGLTHKKKKRRRDPLAARAILQSFLDAHPHNNQR